MAVVTNLVDAVDSYATEASTCASQDTTACLPAVAADCSVLSGASQAAQNAPTIPDSTAERNWSTALSEYVQAAHDCTESANSVNASLLEQAAQKVGAAKGELLSVLDVAGYGSSTPTTAG